MFPESSMPSRRSSGFGYTVSAADRAKEVNENTALLAQLDALLALKLPLPTWCTDGCADLFSVILESADNATKFGYSVNDAADLACYVDANTDDARYAWFADAVAAPERKGWYAAAKAKLAETEARFGTRLYTETYLRELRALTVRRLRTAKNALGLA